MKCSLVGRIGCARFRDTVAAVVEHGAELGTSAEEHAVNHSTLVAPMLEKDAGKRRLPDITEARIFLNEAIAGKSPFAKPVAFGLATALVVLVLLSAFWAAS